jgi:hypothetical protein
LFCLNWFKMCHSNSSRNMPLSPLLNACLHCLLLQEDLSRSQLSALQQLQASVASRKVARHEPLEALARGLLKHVTDDRTDQEQLPSMLKYVVKQAALQTHTAPAAGSAAAGSSSSNGAGSSSGASSSSGAGSSRAAAEAASSSSSSSRAEGHLPAGESSLTDTELLMVLEQLAAAKASEEQLALYQVGGGGCLDTSVSMYVLAWVGARYLSLD